MTTYVLAGFHHSEENSRTYGKRYDLIQLGKLLDQAVMAGCDIISIRVIED